MENQREVERIRQVYETYRQKKFSQTVWSAARNQIQMQERFRTIERVLKSEEMFPLTDFRILDVGCGMGQVLLDLVNWGAAPDNLYGIDLLPYQIEQAKKKLPQSHFQVMNAENLDFPDAFFDMVLLFTVFSSILDDAMAENVAGQVIRILKQNGVVLWYDFRYNNPYNPNVRGMTKALIRRFFPDLTITLQTITLLPPLSRRLETFAPWSYPIFSFIPFLRTHYIGVLRK